MKKDQQKITTSGSINVNAFFSIPALRLKQRQTLKMIVVGVACVCVCMPRPQKNAHKTAKK